jgi:transcriptional regulator with XRE-family HTH domain
MASVFRYRSTGLIDRIKDEMERQKLTQLGLSALVFQKTGQVLPQARISRLLKGGGRPSFEEIELFAAGLGFTPEALLFPPLSKSASQPAVGKIPTGERVVVDTRTRRVK